ncbi:hypothetical protein ACLOJK_003170 [Asimina triloba]
MSEMDGVDVEKYGKNEIASEQSHRTGHLQLPSKPTASDSGQSIPIPHTNPMDGSIFHTDFVSGCLMGACKQFLHKLVRDPHCYPGCPFSPPTLPEASDRGSLSPDTRAPPAGNGLSSCLTTNATSSTVSAGGAHQHGRLRRRVRPFLRADQLPVTDPPPPTV